MIYFYLFILNYYLKKCQFKINDSEYLPEILNEMIQILKEILNTFFLMKKYQKNNDYNI